LEVRSVCPNFVPGLTDTSSSSPRSTETSPRSVEPMIDLDSARFAFCFSFISMADLNKKLKIPRDQKPPFVGELAGAQRPSLCWVHSKRTHRAAPVAQSVVSLAVATRDKLAGSSPSSAPEGLITWFTPPRSERPDSACLFRDCSDSPGIAP
jgi:hypothetical protein